LGNFQRSGQTVGKLRDAKMSGGDEAKEIFFEALACLDERNFATAEALFVRTLKLAPGHIASLNNLAVAQFEQRKLVEASATYDQLLTLKPDLAEGWVGRGNLLTDRRHYDEACLAFDTALSIKPDLADAWLGRGNALNGLQRHGEALSAFDAALSINPDLAEAWLGRGNLFGQVQRYDEALSDIDKGLSINSKLPQGWLYRGNFLTEIKRHAEAFKAYDTAFALVPDFPTAEGSRLFSKMQICDWRDFDRETEHLTSSIRNRKNNCPAFAFLGISASPQDQLDYTRLWSAIAYPVLSEPIWCGEIYNHDRIRIGYVSSDFHQHATSYLIAGLFECHDVSKFELTAISIGPDDDSGMRRRLVCSVPRFFDGRQLSDDEVALQIKKAEIDIVVDLKGFTQNSRAGIFARRPAPIQVNYLGYPGTMAVQYIDYLIADRTVIPETHKDYYTEKIVYLPNSYQVNDAKRSISNKTFTRAECGLPVEGFVFCCFNNSYKILPGVFRSWMTILKRVSGSVLWLLGDNPAAVANLRREAAARGVDPERLVFAERLSLPDHLARHRLADLFLDTLPYNAHTTASDALWAELPVLSQIGETFAGRVSSSLLNAIGAPELIVSTPEAYERRAIDLAADRDRLAAIRQKLAKNRLIAPLFDTQGFARHIEAAYTEMYQRHLKGLPPDDISVRQ
jgi:predicted O-linked N-acetylglucosamine transferase (SPINDLY family)